MTAQPLRILVVDDSAFSRRSITRMLEGMSNVEVVGYAGDGEEGIRQVISLKPDLVTLDLEMPRMDGFTLLRILTGRFNLPVIVVSALAEADKVFKALELGALDFVAKPTSDASSELLLIRDDLQAKVNQARSARIREVGLVEPKASVHKPAPVRAGQRRQQVDLVAIAASTGGPPALQGIFNAFEASYPFAIVVAQHMPPGFTRAFAERLNKNSAFEVREAQDGDIIRPGCALIAPGGSNLLLEQDGAAIRARITSPEGYRYIPSADALFESCAPLYGRRMLAAILTGMGNDGSKGAQAVKARGGKVLAESEESSVVYGMPREAVATGCVDRVVPLAEMPAAILKLGGFQTNNTQHETR